MKLKDYGIPGLKYFDADSRGVPKADRTRNYVTWDQDVLDRSKMLERDGVTLGANKGPTAALPGLLDDVGKGSRAASRLPEHLVPLTDDKLEFALPSTKYLVKKIREKAPDAELGLSLSENQVGKSNYLTLTHPNKRNIEIRLSDHATGPNRAFESAAQFSDYVPEGGKPKFGQISRESFDKRIDEVLSYYDDGIELGANKSPTAALPGLLDDTASRMQRAQDMGFDTDTTYYHGTTHDFDQFGGTTGNVGGYFGAGHYATTSPIDASKNYAGVGPDLTGRIESRAERIAQEVMDDRGVSEEVANRYGRIVATRELKGQHEGAVLPLVARGKTADITGDNQTFLEYNYGGDFDEHLKDARADLGAKASDDEVLDRAYEYQDDYMMSNEPTGELADFIQGLRNQEQYYDFDADEVIGKINELAIDGGMTAMELDDLLRKSDSVMYAGSMDTGDLVGNEIIRNAFNEAGFENIVMDASVAFPHMKNIPMGTKHIITSNPANLRSRFAKFDPAKADSADLLAANPATAALPGLLQDRSGNIDQRGLLRRPPRNQNSFPMRSLLGQRVYTATMPDGSI